MDVDENLIMYDMSTWNLYGSGSLLLNQLDPNTNTNDLEPENNVAWGQRRSQYFAECDKINFRQAFLKLLTKLTGEF